MKQKYNVAIIGQSGVGKSSFVNYLYGQKIMETGVGRPVTKNGFHPVDSQINGLPVTIYDSWGLEVGKEDQWMKELSEELKNRDVSKPASEWFHSVFYCIQAGGARVQDCDVKIVKKFIEANYKVSIILTKADQINEEDEEKLKKAIRSVLPGIGVFSVSSEEKTTRAGVVKPFGKEAIEKKAMSDFFDSIIVRLPLRCEGIMISLRGEWYKSCQDQVTKINIGGFNSSEISQELERITVDLARNIHECINQEINSTLSLFDVISTKLGSVSINHDVYACSASFKKTESTMEWYEVVAATVLFVPIVLAGLIFGDKWSKDELKEKIESSKSEVDKKIRAIVEDVSTKLKQVRPV